LPRTSTLAISSVSARTAQAPGTTGSLYLPRPQEIVAALSSAEMVMSAFGSKPATRAARRSLTVTEPGAATLASAETLTEMPEAEHVSETASPAAMMLMTGATLPLRAAAMARVRWGYDQLDQQ
jgi:hypothetical protein